MEIVIWILVIIAVIAIIVWLLRRNSHPDPQDGTAPETAPRTGSGTAAQSGQQRGSGTSSPIVQSTPPVSNTAAASSAGAAAAADSDESYESSLEQEDQAADPIGGAGTGRAEVPAQPPVHSAAAAEGSDGYTDTGRLYSPDDPSTAPGREVAGAGSAKAAGTDDIPGSSSADGPSPAGSTADGPSPAGSAGTDDTEGGAKAVKPAKATKPPNSTKPADTETAVSDDTEGGSNPGGPSRT